jgi:hypothetical protein
VTRYAPFLDGLRAHVVTLRAENDRLLRILELTPQQARPPGPEQTAFFDRVPGPVHAGSPPAAEVGCAGGVTVGDRAHAWLFFSDPVPTASARRLGTGLLRERSR